MEGGGSPCPTGPCWDVGVSCWRGAGCLRVIGNEQPDWVAWWWPQDTVVPALFGPNDALRGNRLPSHEQPPLPPTQPGLHATSPAWCRRAFEFACHPQVNSAGTVPWGSQGAGPWGSGSWRVPRVL